MARRNPDMLELFQRDPVQGYELFHAACKLADGLTKEVAKAKAEAARARTASAVGHETVADALASLLARGLLSSAPDRRAPVRKMFRGPK